MGTAEAMFSLTDKTPAVTKVLSTLLKYPISLKHKTIQLCNKQLMGSEIYIMGLMTLFI